MIKVLVTGSSGFIGFHLCNNLLKNKFFVIGIDSHNKYYSTKLKNKRLSFLKKKKNFVFKKINIQNKIKTEQLFLKFKPTIVFHLAGQPGVLYSLKNPNTYKANNVKATENISSLSKKFKVQQFILGSSSSVYGDQTKFPIKETFFPKPKNPYARTKLKSEKIVIQKLNDTSTKFTIFRFFTVYGPFGRPDMFIHKFLNSIKRKKKIKLYNSGLNFRDFTYVDDLIKILIKSINNKSINKKIINICRSKPILTNQIVKLILKNFKTHHLKIVNTKFVKGEMKKTHGCNNLLKKYFRNIKFTNIQNGINNTIRIFKKYEM